MDIKAGNIYRWSFTDAYREKHKDSVQAGTLYWTLDQIAVAMEDEMGEVALYDTYKYDKYRCGDDIFSLSKLNQCVKLKPDIVEIDAFLGNQKDYSQTNKDAYNIYNQSDLLELRIQHGYSTIYLLKGGATPCVQTSIDNLKKEVFDLEYTIRSATGSLGRALEQIALLEESL